MKNIKLKHFAVALMMVLQWSCATTEIPQASEQISKTDLFSEGSMLNEYKNFKIDGVVTNDTKKLEAMSNNAHVVFYDPEMKEVDFYSSEASYRKFNPEIEQDEKVIEGVQATTAISFPDNFNDIGGFGADVSGVSGLGTIIDQGYFRNYDNQIFFVNKNNVGFTGFVRMKNFSSFDNLVPGIGVSKDGVVSRNDFNLKTMFANIASGTITRCTIKNDTDNNRNLYFYKFVNKNPAQPRVLLRMPKNSAIGLGSGFLSSIGGICQSFESVTY